MTHSKSEFSHYYKTFTIVSSVSNIMSVLSDATCHIAYTQGQVTHRKQVVLGQQKRWNGRNTRTWSRSLLREFGGDQVLWNRHVTTEITHSRTHPLTTHPSPTHALTHSPPHPLMHSPTHPITHSPTHPFTHSPDLRHIHNLKNHNLCSCSGNII